MAVLKDKNKCIKPGGSYRLTGQKGVSGDFATILAIKTEFSVIISAGRTMCHTRTHSANRLQESILWDQRPPYDAAAGWGTEARHQGKILESLATNVVDRAMLHADRGNSGKGVREKKESPRGDAVKQLCSN